MGDLVLAHGHRRRLVHEDVRGLEHRVTEEAVGQQILLAQILLLILVGGNALQPAQRSDHGQQQVQLGVLRHPRLDEQGGELRIHAAGEPVDDHVPDVAGNDLPFLIGRRQRMPVGDEEIALVFVLQPQPVLQHAVVVAQVQTAGRPHTGQHAALPGIQRAQTLLLNI